MADDLISETVRDFIANNIDSVAELEALLLLRSDRLIHWGIDALSERLYTNHEQTEDVMSKLTTSGLSGRSETKPITFHYRPSPEGVDETVGALAETCSKYLVPVTNLIHAKPQSRVQQFADAFNLRKRRDD